MADEETKTEQPDDLRSALASAIATQESESALVVDTGKEAAAKPAAEAKGDEDGAAEAKTEEKVEEKADAEEKKDAADADTKADAKDDKDEKPAADGKSEAPAKYSKQGKELFAQASPQLQQFLIKREAEIARGFTKKDAETAAFRKEYEPVDRVFAPHREVMKQKGLTVEQLVTGWAGIEQRLAGGENSAIGVIQGLIKGYNIPVDKLVSALGAPAARRAENGADLPAAETAATRLSPELEAKLARLDELTPLQRWVEDQKRTQADNARRQAAANEDRVGRDIESFRSETDGKGNLLHPHFEEVENDMLELALGARASNKPVPPLKDLYERAVHANPTTRAQVLAAQRQQEQQKRDEEARQKAAAARKAATSVTGAPNGAGQTPTNKGGADKSLREQLMEAAADAAS